MRKLVMLLLAVFAPAVNADGVPSRPLTAEEIRPRAISIPPDGRNLPPGSATARLGKKVYDQQCAACHGARGEGVAGFPPLAGGIGSLASKAPLPTVGAFWPYATGVWDYINRAMPYQAPGSLSAEEVYGATAYVLYLNGIITEEQRLDATSLPNIRMPNRDGFVDDPRPATLY